ncbi:MAG: hypothetical protein ACJ8GN_26595 [Longimicrobiaceae bacterium]
MDSLERYLNGEHERVWSEFQALGPAVRNEPHLSAARAVGAETMRRVRRNCEMLVDRLRAAGYVFGIYPDGSDGYYSEGPLVAPSDATRAALARLEARVGPLPLSLVAFWEEVGLVDLVGMRRSWPERLDPLVVGGPAEVLAELDDWEEDQGDEDEPEPFEGGLAPDDLHKDNVSGGPPYGVQLPYASADFRFLNERHDLFFVPYLRLAILRCGGFPGLDRLPGRMGLLDELTQGLEPF